MLIKVNGTLVLIVALIMVFSVVVTEAKADDSGRIFPAWFFRAHSSDDKELWGNRGIGPRGYFTGGGTSTETWTVEERESDSSRDVSTHTVVKGECLWYIAGYEHVYGDPTKWPLIYRANRDKIKDPDLIYPGQVLKIPR